MRHKIFKEGNKVFDIRFGWGEVVSVENDTLYPVSVIFDVKEDNSVIKNTQTSYLSDGRSLTSSKVPTLSFSEYTFEGFSQERPIDYKDYIGSWGVFKDKNKKDIKVIGKLETFERSKSDGKLIFTPYNYPNFFDTFEPLAYGQIKLLNLE